ncbi:AAA family ATPase [Rhodococcus qingshengii]|nr:AAA family ATPase [Rhodococcus qingshengii]
MNSLHNSSSQVNNEAGDAVLEKIIIKNFKSYQDFQLEFNPDMNIIVGDNEAGKSTLLDSINLALTGRLAGKSLQNEISPHLFNQTISTEYIQQVNTGKNPIPPEIIVDLFLAAGVETARLSGTNNLTKEDRPGVRVRVAYNNDYAAEYKAFLSDKKASCVPVEYYAVEWMDFSGNSITARSVPVAASLINAANIRLHNGADYYLQKIINGHLNDKERVELSRAYRDLKSEFSLNSSIAGVNGKLDSAKGDVSDKTFSLSADLSPQSGWESGLIPHLNNLPFSLIGSGEQNTLKILLAITRKLEDSHAILIEEPENHLSFSTLNKLIRKIEDKCVDRQVIMTTHSSYVINKLGLSKLILLNEQKVAKMTNLPSDTQDYFMKLSGYDTLRLVLAEKTLMVEGPSDELVVQRAYMDIHQKRLPIHDGVDVLNIRGLSSKRFLQIAAILGKEVHVITDNDGDSSAVAKKYEDFSSFGNIHINVSKDVTLPSLEQHIASLNGLEKMNRILNRSYPDIESLLHYMTNDNNKTTCALAVFSTPEDVTIPEYILDAIK